MSSITATHTLLDNYTIQLQNEEILVRVVQTVAVEIFRWEVVNATTQLPFGFLESDANGEYIHKFTYHPKIETITSLLLGALLCKRLEKIECHQSIYIIAERLSFPLYRRGFIPIFPEVQEKMSCMATNESDNEKLEGYKHYLKNCDMVFCLEHPTVERFQQVKALCAPFFICALLPLLENSSGCMVVYDYLFNTREQAFASGGSHFLLNAPVKLDFFSWNFKEEFVFRALRESEVIGSCHIAWAEKTTYLYVIRLDNHTVGKKEKIQGVGTLLLTCVLCFSEQFPRLARRVQLGALEKARPFYNKLGFAQVPKAPSRFLYIDLNWMDDEEHRDWKPRMDALNERVLTLPLLRDC